MIRNPHFKYFVLKMKRSMLFKVFYFVSENVITTLWSSLLQLMTTECNNWPSLPAAAMVTPVIMLVRWKDGWVFGEGLLAAFGGANGAKWHSFRFLLLAIQEAESKSQEKKDLPPVVLYRNPKWIVMDRPRGIRPCVNTDLGNY